MRTIYLLLLCLISSAFSATFQNVQIRTKPTLYEKLEISFSLVPSNGGTYANPYDPDLIEVSSRFTSPTGKQYPALCFYYTDFTRSGSIGRQVLTPGDSMWLCRFSPNEVGTWTFVLEALENEEHSSYNPRQTFNVENGNGLGFIRISNSDPNYFVHERDQSTFFPIGENLCWAKDTFDYDRYLPKLNANNATYIRIWMSVRQFGIETQTTGLGDYRKSQDEAWQLDYVMNEAGRLGIYVMICMDYALAFSGQSQSWSINPYNKANGGPLNTADSLWSSSEAFGYFERRFRYIVARWGYATNLLSWELWNEVDGTQNFRSVASLVTAWHQNSYAAVRQHDVHKHLITTSFQSFPGHVPIWQVLDYLQIHFYSAADMAGMAMFTISNLKALVPNKPVYVAEYGTDWNWNNPDILTNDVAGINLHNEQWGSLVALGAAGGFSWWWDNIIDPENQYYNYRGIALFVAGEDLDKQNYKSVTLDATTSVYSNSSVFPLLSWGTKPPANVFILNSDGSLTPNALSLSQFQYGSLYNTELRNPPTFVVDFHVPGTFSIFVSSFSSAGAATQISIDGTVVLEKQITLSEIISVPVPKGNHSIFVNSVGKDWFTVSQFQFSSSVYAISAHGLIGNSKAIGWVKSNTHTWFQVRHGEPQAVVPDGKITLNVCDIANEWSYSWWNTITGAVQSSGSVTCSCNGDGCLQLNVPLIDGKSSFDWAVKLVKRSQH